MNTKFKEIAEKAGFVLFTPEEDPRTPIDWSCDYEVELQEFAKLIIKECMNVARNADDVNVHGVGFGYSIAMDISDHFGVDL